MLPGSAPSHGTTSSSGKPSEALLALVLDWWLMVLRGMAHYTSYLWLVVLLSCEGGGRGNTKNTKTFYCLQLLTTSKAWEGSGRLQGVPGRGSGVEEAVEGVVGRLQVEQHLPDLGVVQLV